MIASKAKPFHNLLIFLVSLIFIDLTFSISKMNFQRKYMEFSIGICMLTRLELFLKENYVRCLNQSNQFNLIGEHLNYLNFKLITICLINTPIVWKQISKIRLIHGLKWHMQHILILSTIKMYVESHNLLEINQSIDISKCEIIKEPYPNRYCK